MTQLQAAVAGHITPAMEQVARDEHVAPEAVREAVARGHAVIPLNPAHRRGRPTGVGRLFRTKVNANIGRSPARSGPGEELRKLRAALTAGADFVMDLSVGPGLAAIRRDMLETSPAPLGTVPVYEALSRTAGAGAGLLDADLLLEVIAGQAAEGVDFMTLHAGLLRAHLPAALRRVTGIVSRGGAIMAEWMQRHGRENPLHERWDEVLEIMAAHDVTVSLGDGLRPGCLADAGDEAQFAELEVLGELVRRARARGVQAMVEGPGHVSFDQIAMNMRRQQELCDGAPFYVLGPVVTDIAPGHDHIAGAIGATAATFHGAALLCYVTPAEHLGLPDAGEVREGVLAFRIAAHAGDVARGLPGARAADDAMAEARAAFDWERQFRLALDGRRARARWRRTRSAACAGPDEHCSMCGEDFCALRATRRLREAAAGASRP
jgi:phosphomethylpyrimidine synthase